MKKISIVLVVLIVLALAYWLISPLFISKHVSEDFPAAGGGASGIELSLIKQQGSFQGFDSVHYGSGDVVAIETGEGWTIRFEENFNVANGPDLYVGFGKDGKYIKGSEIGKLKGNIGSQNYEVPSNLNIADYNEVWVWCRAFSVGFAKAKLNPV